MNAANDAITKEEPASGEESEARVGASYAVAGYGDEDGGAHAGKQKRGIAHTHERVTGEDDEPFAPGCGAGGRNSAKPSHSRVNGGGNVQNKGRRTRSRGVAKVGPVQVVDGYEKVMLEDGGFKKPTTRARTTRACIRVRMDISKNTHARLHYMHDNVHVCPSSV